MKLSFFIQRLQEYAAKDPEAKVGLLITDQNGVNVAMIGGMQLLEGFRDNGDHESVLVLADRPSLQRFDDLDPPSMQAAVHHVLDYFENVEQASVLKTKNVEFR